MAETVARRNLAGNMERVCVDCPCYLPYKEGRRPFRGCTCWCHATGLGRRPVPAEPEALDRCGGCASFHAHPNRTRPCRCECHSPLDHSSHRAVSLVTKRERVREEAIRAGSSPNHQRRVFRIMDRDGEDCWLCGLILDGDITLDHVTPKAKGGSNRLTNLRLAHDWCNQRRADTGCTAEEWRAKWGSQVRRVIQRRTTT